MATLQVYQAQALKELHEGGPDQGVLEELPRRSNTCGSLWLRWQTPTRLAFLTLPSPRVASSATLSRTLPSSSQQSRSRRRPSSTSCPAVNLPSRRQLPNLRLPVAKGAPPRPPKKNPNLLRPPPSFMRPGWLDVELAVGEVRRPPLRDRLRTHARDLLNVPDAGNSEVEKMALQATTTSTSSLPVEGRELLCTLTLPPAHRSAVPKTSQKEPIFSPLGPRPRVPVSSGTCLPSRYRTRSCLSPAQEPGKKVSAALSRPGRFSFWVQSPSRYSPRLPHHGHVGQRSLDSPGEAAGSLASASQPLAVVDTDGTSRLCDSIRQASAQVQRRSLHYCPFGHTCRCSACGGRGPTGEGRDRASPSS
ncbi:uncharacterized protein [Garra rufa]|uniref:uncharacterized protein n=1 Tax=Garra rufa TaxID=137080 RepID=UPI003CCE7912